MGIDAVMKFVTINELTDDEIRMTHYNLLSICHSSLSIGYGKERELCISRKDGCTNQYEVNLMSIYYGPRYERGPIMDFILIAEFLEFTFPGCIVYYGGDCDESYEVFNSYKREELKLHYFINAHRPYNQGGLSSPTERANGPICPLCKVTTNQYGWGEGKGAWSCLACGWNYSELADPIFQGWSDKFV
jgi:hypothetical protein